MIDLDGSTLEGGGQLTRVALSLSAIYRLPIRVSRVRANRGSKFSKRGAGASGGLKESHLAALHWLADMCNAKTQGDEVGSEEFVFRPSSKRGLIRGPSDSTIELRNPGSVWLVLQALLPFILFAIDVPVLELTLKGGTNVSKSMSGEYVQQVLIPTLHRIGLPDIEVDIVKRGWTSPVSQIGEVKVMIKAAKRHPFVLPAFDVAERGAIKRVAVTILAHTEAMRNSLRVEVIKALGSQFPAEISVDVVIDEESGSDSRLYLLLVAHTANGWVLGRDCLYNRRIRTDREARVMAEKASENVVGQLTMELSKGGCVDEYLQDQLVIWQALASGASRVDAGRHGADHDEGSLHTKTVRWVCEQMMGNHNLFQADGRCVGTQPYDARTISRSDIAEMTPVLEEAAIDDEG
ncbi:RNA 3'-phosphate cyclase [Cyphellophora europaea CBS 101466]|uniref:RNA 3'-phosphate cyclase n=1 Tax=Cyphellophora europaea (strain CBS 101466) TaxID=1220924 RepID=W2SCU2_CYPE1|nr:RNA 3'-phosphate cyclase [Cyphellophora europaea CBS 101466]ETN46512.1 RNA 3'-phosphate cyclase [Cyphellophora europaea CBS 101466]